MSVISMKQLLEAGVHFGPVSYTHLNVAAVKMKLSELNIRLLSEDCGLNYGRTVEFYSETGEYVIKSVGKPRKVI